MWQCPAHLDDNPSLSISEGTGGTVLAKCFTGCSFKSIRAALGLQTTYAPDYRPAPPARPRPAGGGDYHRRLWRQVVAIAFNADHPARLWLASRHLWWPELPLPRSVGWIPSTYDKRHQGAGAIIRLLAPGPAWTAAWPGLPHAAAVQLVSIDADGMPALDRAEVDGGVSKRTYGSASGAVTLLGEARPDLGVGLDMAEGLADALALASRRLETAATTSGTSGLPALGEPPASTWLALWPALTLWADDDSPGIEAARKLRSALARQDIPLDARTLPGRKDAANATKTSPLPVLDLDVVREFAKDLESEGLPRWEAARIAALSTTTPAGQEDTE